MEVGENHAEPAAVWPCTPGHKRAATPVQSPEGVAVQRSHPGPGMADFWVRRRWLEDAHCGGSGRDGEGGGGRSVGGGELVRSGGRRRGGSQWRGSLLCRSDLERGMLGGTGGGAARDGRRREEGKGGRECSSSLVGNRMRSLEGRGGSGRACWARRDGSWAGREPERPGSHGESQQLRPELAVA